VLLFFFPSFFSPLFFFPPVSSFFLSTPPGPSSDFYNLLLVAPRSTAGRQRVSGAAHPEKPENRGKQKRPARRASRRDGNGGWWGRTGGERDEKKEKASRDRRDARSSARGRAYPARAVAGNYFSAASRPCPAGIRNSDTRISNARSFRRRTISIDGFFPHPAIARGTRPNPRLIRRNRNYFLRPRTPIEFDQKPCPPR